jgi:CBS domain-containing protein
MQDQIRNVLDHKGRRVVTVAAEVTVTEAVARMNAHNIGSVLVGDDRTPVGIFTERDVLVRVIACNLDPRTTRVGDVMTREVITVTTETTIEEAMSIVTERRCRHLPVTDEDGCLCGLISSGDLTKWVVNDQRQTIDDLNGYIRAS